MLKIVRWVLRLVDIDLTVGNMSIFLLVKFGDVIVIEKSWEFSQLDVPFNWRASKRGEL